ncbi:uncharacterized protein [Parasteatoda tepidariorum]|uniref:uncharacterized protein isoform X5 n=1 Tax=Parasteatoda tepidariorum TaxID=114398 RepID=UPI001C724207|nr:DNA-directed RNA polymerase II subunit RPB1 isoform X4 [Parasteatoda tepidariorum]
MAPSVYYKSCIVTRCNSSACNTPNKLFFSVPKGQKRQDWLKAIKRDESRKLSAISPLYCCEDHFTLEEDMVNYMRYKITNNVNYKKLKPGVVPHIFSYQQSTVSKGLTYKRRRHHPGQPSKNPSDPDYVPSVFDTSSKNTSPRKTSTTPPADDTESDKTTQVWTSLLQLQPITSEAGTSGLSEPSAQNQKPEEPEKPSTKAAVTGIWKSKTKPKPKPRPRKRPRTPSPPPAESKIIDPLKLCVVKMEIEDDGYNQNEEESFLASLTPSSSQTSHNDTLSFDSASSIKTEPNQEPTIYKLVPTISESAPTNSTQQDVEVFFKNVAQTVMQLPLHLIEETKTKVSALVYEMVIQAMREGSTNITQHKL